MKFPFFAITAFILGSVSAYAGNDPIFRNMSQTQELDSLLDELNSLSHAPQPVHAPAPVSHAPAHVHHFSHSPAAGGQQHARMEQIDPPMGGRGNDDLDFNLPPEQDNGPAARHHGPHHSHHQCFTAGTWVFTPDHRTPFKAIELLVHGDKVWSCNTDESQCVEREVVNVSVTKTSELVLVHTQQANGTEEVIKTTPDHPFYKEGEKTPTFARDLEKGNSLWAYQDAVTVTQVELKEVHPSVLVYNIQVEAPEGGNNYFVGEHLVLVHNCNMGEAAVAAAATGACAVEGARCVIGAAVVVGEIAAAPETGGGSLAGIPVTAGQTAEACARATAACGVAGAAAGVQDMFSSGGDGAAGGDSAVEEVRTVHPSAPVGRRGEPIEVARGTNAPTSIGGRQYTGHSLDSMQGRGVPSTAVENAIQIGTRAPGRTPGTTVHSIPGLRVITNASGDVVTVIPQ